MKELGKLDNLQFLFLDNNKLTGEIPKELCNLDKLWFLYIQNNKLIGEILSEFEQLNLQGFYSNQVPPKKFENIYKLDDNYYIFTK